MPPGPPASTSLSVLLLERSRARCVSVVHLEVRLGLVVSVEDGMGADGRADFADGAVVMLLVRKNIHKLDINTTVRPSVISPPYFTSCILSLISRRLHVGWSPFGSITERRPIQWKVVQRGAVRRRQLPQRSQVRVICGIVARRTVPRGHLVDVGPVRAHGGGAARGHRDCYAPE